MDGVRRFVLFILGIICLIGSLAEDPVHLTSLFVGLMLMGVITWDQISSFVANRGRHSDATPLPPPAPPTSPSDAARRQ